MTTWITSWNGLPVDVGDLEPAQGPRLPAERLAEIAAESAAATAAVAAEVRAADDARRAAYEADEAASLERIRLAVEGAFPWDAP